MTQFKQFLQQKCWSTRSRNLSKIFRHFTKRDISYCWFSIHIYIASTPLPKPHWKITTTPSNILKGTEPNGTAPAPKTSLDTNRRGTEPEGTDSRFSDSVLEPMRIDANHGNPGYPPSPVLPLVQSPTQRLRGSGKWEQNYISQYRKIWEFRL